MCKKSTLIKLTLYVLIATSLLPGLMQAWEPEEHFNVLHLPIASQELLSIPIEENGDELIDLSTIKNPRILMRAQFRPLNFLVPLQSCFVRKGLYLRLLIMLQHLPNNVGIVCIDGYRTLATQKEYFDKKFKELFARLNNAQIAYDETSKQISPLINNTPVHCTGAALDLTLFEVTADGSLNILDMGQGGVTQGKNDQMETFTDTISPVQKNNRIMLLRATTKAGLVNYGHEWWHYSFGDRAWAFVLKKPAALYGLIDGEKMVKIASSVEEYCKNIMAQ
jgi:zinc D-Ala-D-Ala dipeptidase